jgi:hypothetical protein
LKTYDCNGLDILYGTKIVGQISKISPFLYFIFANTPRSLILSEYLIDISGVTYVSNLRGFGCIVSSRINRIDVMKYICMQRIIIKNI